MFINYIVQWIQCVTLSILEYFRDKHCASGCTCGSEKFSTKHSTHEDGKFNIPKEVINYYFHYYSLSVHYYFPSFRIKTWSVQYLAICQLVVPCLQLSWKSNIVFLTVCPSSSKLNFCTFLYTCIQIFI